MKLSIIIPTYNIEKYIKECIYSCYNQQGVSTDDYEIIVVNDGSTDRSVDVVVEAQQEIPNLRIVSRPNGGLSAARNTGLDCAKGEFVWFVDGDDCIEANALSILFKAFQQHDCDAYIINYSTFTEQGIHKMPNFQLPSNRVFSGRYFWDKYKRMLPVMSWLTIFKKEFLLKNDLVFTEGIIHEDIDFSMRSFSMAKNIFFLNMYLYLYRIDNNTSIMSKAKKDCTKSIISYVQILRQWDDFFGNHQLQNLPIIKKTQGMLSYLIIKNLMVGHFSPNKEIDRIARNKRVFCCYLWRSHILKYAIIGTLLMFLPERILRKIFQLYFK